MKLIKYKVQTFRSVKDSGWIECDNVTTLVGINESGKTNLLLALWKLNPVRGGEIDPLNDLPVEDLTELRSNLENVPFISAQFEIGEESAARISETLLCKCLPTSVVAITRYYDGHYSVVFENDKPKRNKARTTNKVEEEKLLNNVDEQLESFEKELNDTVISEMPKFIYYSNYGNLSSRIYLPFAIKWLNGEKITGIDIKEDQVRTLQVLFDFVGLKPKEILDLGKDPRIIAAERSNSNIRSVQPTDNDIKKAADDKRERSILLQSAGRKLSKEFRNWWKQGTYNFRFEADGDYFSIMVSDDKRPAEVSLELRSTGLQWFLSFFLIFLVERNESHENAILLLDEAGLTLHPLAQKNLIAFFNELSKSNPIINTTHSPFIVDTDNIDRCRVVYSDKDGYTVASSDLRANTDSQNSKSIYALHAALGLSVSNVLLEGCTPVIVEGPSDQNYFNGIKTFLIREGMCLPKHDIVFIPSGGVRGIDSIVSLIGGKNSELPYVVVDSDSSGEGKATKLKSSLYAGANEKVIELKDFTNVETAEVEDIIPFKLLQRSIDKLFGEVEDKDFEYDQKKPLVNQIETFALNNGVNLPEGWKVKMAKEFKKKISTCAKNDIDEIDIKCWKSIFEKFEQI